MQRLRKRFSAQIQAGEGERAVVAAITTEVVDRDGEVLLVSGMDATDFVASPTVFYNHDYNKPVGRCDEIYQATDHIQAKTVFATRPENHQGEWLPDSLLHLYRERVINGFSIGFDPIESRRPSKADRQRWGDRLVRVFSKWKIFEYSSAPLPSNQRALQLAVSKGVVSESIAKTIMPGVDFSMRRKTMIVIPYVIPAKPKPKKRTPQKVRKPDKKAIADKAMKIVEARMRGRIYIDP